MTYYDDTIIQMFGIRPNYLHPAILQYLEENNQTLDPLEPRCHHPWKIQAIVFLVFSHATFIVYSPCSQFSSMFNGHSFFHPLISISNQLINYATQFTCRFEHMKIMYIHMFFILYWSIPVQSFPTTFSELDEWKLYRKPLYLQLRTMVSCRSPLKPNH